MARNATSTKERITVYNVLREHCRSIEGTDLCAYDKDWSDSRVAKESGVATASEDTVARIRRDMFGDLQPHAKSGSAASGLKALGAGLMSTQRDVAALTKAFNELADAIGEGVRKVPERKP